MAIRIQHGNVDTLAQAANLAGQAQAGVREQQLAEQQRQFNESLVQQQLLQTQQIESQQQMQAAQLANAALARDQQMKQFQAELAARQEQAQENATVEQTIRDRQFDLEERGLTLREAVAMREEQRLEQDIQRQKILNLAGTQEIQQRQEDRASNLAEWQSLKEQMSPDVYAQGLIAIRQGKTPRIPSEARQGLTTYQRLQVARQAEQDIIKNQEKLNRRLTQRVSTTDLKNAQALGKQILKPGKFFDKGFDDLRNAYIKYTQDLGYGQLNPTQQALYDTAWDNMVNEADEDSWFKDINQPAIEAMRRTLRLQGESYIQRAYQGIEGRQAQQQIGPPDVITAEGLAEAMRAMEGR